MARGRYGKAAAQRRAQSAEDQLDRLLPELVEAKRLAGRYRSEAEQAPVLRAELARLRDVVGVPVAEHDATVSDLQRRHREEIAELENACCRLFSEFARWVVVEDESKFISGHLMIALQDAPRSVASSFLAALGIEREMSRFLLNGDPDRISHSEDVHREVSRMAYRAVAEGHAAGTVPASFLPEEDRTNEQYVPRPSKTGRVDDDAITVEEASADLADAVRDFAARRGHDSDEHAIGPLLREVYDCRGILCSARRRERETANG